MTYELLLQNRQGIIKDFSTTCENIQYVTNRTGSPGKFTFDIWKTDETSFHEGDRVRFSVNGTLVFFGFVFTKKKDKYGKIEVVCYDQMRYINVNDSYCFVGKKAGDIIREIADNFQLEVGEIADTGYTIPYFVKEDKNCLDIISEALEMTLLNTGRIYVFFDDGGKLTLKESKDMMETIAIGDGSMVNDYTYTTDIDSDTYNRVKLVRPNKETGRADTYILEDSSTQALWGTLQIYEQVDEEMNPAQITEQAETMLKYYNRVSRTLDLPDMIGILGLRAGSMIMTNIKELGDISLSKYILLDKVTHNFESDTHTMDLSAKITL